METREGWDILCLIIDWSVYEVVFSYDMFFFFISPFLWYICSLMKLNVLCP